MMDIAINKISLYSLAPYIVKYLKDNDLYRTIVDRLHNSKYEIFITGGFIRDLLNSGRFSNDVDFTTDATPDEIKKLFYDKKFATGGEAFLVSFVDGVEIATYRRDVKNTGNRGECCVKRAKSLEEDLSRRDFTINAIAFSPITGEFIDLYNGVNDIRDSKINFIGNPIDRIHEDRERILRACRFIAVMDGSFGTVTFKALRENSYLVKNVSPERISLEIKKAMKIRNASNFFNSMRLIGCLDYVFPSLKNCFDKDGGPWHNETIYNHCMDAGDAIRSKYPLVKLTAYLHDVGKGVCSKIDNKDHKLKFIGHEMEGARLIEKELRRLHFSNDEVKKISGLISVHMNSFSKKLSKRATKRFLVRLEELNIDYRDWFRMFIADKHGNRKSRDFKFGEIRSFIGKVKYLFENENIFSIKDLAINGHDVMKTLDIIPGPKVGKILKAVFEYCLNFPGDNYRKFLLEYILTLDI